MERLFALDAQLIHDTLWTALAIFILFFFFCYLLFNPVRKMLEKRKKKITDELSEAEASLKEAEAMKAEYDEKMRNVKEETNAILDEARHNAVQSRTAIINEAKEDAARIRQKAAADIEQEKLHARDGMKQEMVDIASKIAEKVVSGNMNAEVEDRLIDETLGEIGKKTWQDQ